MPASLVVHEFTAEDDGGVAIPIIQASGRLDAGTVSILERALLRTLHSAAKVIILDLSEVTYISSSGLRVLLTCRRQLRERQGELILCALSQNVRDVFDMVGFTALFGIVDTLEQARHVAAETVRKIESRAGGNT
ncbi:MAG: STAS domain-containing protein [Anaerolineae bacterium]|nr:STAS domain-containing protein [Thermoflexales bacterium]MDW8408959.1 STAS domain-containing protein [Anaerolineae bacterium]